MNGEGTRDRTSGTAAGGRLALPGAELWAAGPRRALRAKVSCDKFGGGERWSGAVPGLKAERSPHPLTSGGWASDVTSSLTRCPACCALADL